MSKKVLSVLVALCMMVSLFAVAANAAVLKFEEDDSAYEQMWSLTDPADNGDGTYEVDVVLTTNYGVGQIQFKLETTGTVAIDSVVNNVDDIFELSYSNSTNKFILVANSAGSEQIDAPVYDAQSLVTLTVSGQGTLAIVDDPKTADNVGGTLIAARMDNGDIVNGDPVLGQMYSFDVQEVTIGATAAPVLQVIDGMNGYINTNYTQYNEDDSGVGTPCDGFIYGVEATELGETIDSVFEVVNGTMEIVPSYLAGGSETGTGATVLVKDSSDNVVATYVFVLFGDIDGNGDIDTDDENTACLHAAWMYEDGPDGMRIYDSAVLFAGDVLGEGDISTDSADVMARHAAWMYEDGTDGMRMSQSDAVTFLTGAGIL
ncbi:MAG: hypothetical protein ACI4IF_05335 [Acutalibacteraceae bacterium]